MRREPEEETATATGRAVRHLTQEPTLLPQVLARRDKVDPRTLAVNGRPLITSQPGDKSTIFLLCVRLDYASNTESFPGFLLFH